MKVFLSWSGDMSLKIACAFRDWLPSVIQSVKPYVSSEDIDKGSRWSTDIAKELEASTYGILSITKDNIDAPWINFEAGALSKTIDKSKVSPFLFNIKRSEVKGPLLQFQSTVFDKDDIAKLVLSINNSQEEKEKLDETRLKKVFDVWWPQLNETLVRFSDEKAEPRHEKHLEPSKQQGLILEELLELARNQQKLLRSPESILPPDYLTHVMEKGLPVSRGPDPRMFEVSLLLRKMYDQLQERLEEVKKLEPENSNILKLEVAITELGDPIIFLFRRLREMDRFVNRRYNIKE